MLKGKADDYVAFDEERKYFVVTLKYEKAKGKLDKRKVHKSKKKKNLITLCHIMLDSKEGKGVTENKLEKIMFPRTILKWHFIDIDL